MAEIQKIDVVIKYGVEGKDAAVSASKEFEGAVNDTIEAVKEQGDAVAKTKKEIEAATTVEMEAANAKLHEAEKVQLLVEKLALLAKDYANVSKAEGDHQKQLNGIALQYKSVQAQLSKITFSPNSPELVTPFQNMSDEGLKAKSKLELLELKLQQISEEMRNASLSTEDQSKKLIELASRYRDTADKIEKMKAAMNAPAEPTPVEEPAFTNMEASTITSATKIELLQMRLDMLKQKLDECSASTKDQTEKMISLGMQYNSTKEQLDKLVESMNETTTAVEESGDEAEKSESKFGKFLAQLKRIAVYRAIRTALKEITQAFKEGINNLYEWSKLNDTTFASSMDNLATSALYLKNALGTALAPVIQDYVVPAIYAISEAVADAVNWLNQLIAILKGESTYTKAIRKQTEFAKSTGSAAKELKRMLMGFDEINRLSDNSGGSGSSIDYNGMFETATVDETLSAQLDSLKLTVKDVFFDWSNLTGEQICEKAIAGLGMLAGGVAGFMIGGVPGAIIGSLAGLVFSLIASSLIFDHDGEMSEKEVLTMLIGVLGGIVGGVIGFAIGGPGGALIGTAIGFGLTASLSSLLFSNGAGKFDKNKLYSLLLPTMIGILGAVVLGIALGPAGALIGLSIGLALTFNVLKAEWGKTDKVELLSVPTPNANPTGVNRTGGYNETVTESGTYAEKFYSGKYGIGSGGLSTSLKNQNSITTKASGGFVDSGSLFIAGEAGAEFVGNINGRTGVMNADQFSEANRPVTEAVYAIGSAIVGAVNGIEMPSVKIGDREIYKASERGKRLTGTSLVMGVR